MDEIDVGGVLDPAKERRRGLKTDLVPPHVRDGKFFPVLRHPLGKPDDPAGDYIQTLVDSELLALGKKKLQPEADPEKRPAITDDLQDRLDKSPLLQISHAVPESADTGEDDLGSFEYDPRVRGDHGLEADLLEPFLYGTEIPHPVIDYCNHYENPLNPWR